MTATAAATNADKLRAKVRELEPTTLMAVGRALGWNNEKTRMTAKPMLKRGHLVRDTLGLISTGAPPRKLAPQVGRALEADSKQSRNAAIAKHFHNKLIGVAEGSTQPMTSQEWEALGGVVQILAPTEVSPASRLRFSYSEVA